MIWTLKSYLPLRYMEANPDKTEFHPDELIERMRRNDYRKQIDLIDTFIKLTRVHKKIEIRWSRRQHHPRFRAYMIGVQLAREQ